MTGPEPPENDSCCPVGNSECGLIESKILKVIRPVFEPCPAAIYPHHLRYFFNFSKPNFLIMIRSFTLFGSHLN
jgi:hypothetical protein